MLSLKIRGYVITTITILGNSFNQGTVPQTVQSAASLPRNPQAGQPAVHLLHPAPLATSHAVHFANILASDFGQGLTKVY
jgi:hypothetical protein